MRPVSVVVLEVLVDDDYKMATTEDEHPVQTFAPDGPDEAFGKGVGPWSFDRRSNDQGQSRSTRDNGHLKTERWRQWRFEFEPGHHSFSIVGSVISESDCTDHNPCSRTGRGWGGPIVMVRALVRVRAIEVLRSKRHLITLPASLAHDLHNPSSAQRSGRYDYGSEGCRFESCRAREIVWVFSLVRGRNSV